MVRKCDAAVVARSRLDRARNRLVFSGCRSPLALPIFVLPICVPRAIATDPFQFLPDTLWEVPCLIYPWKNER